MMIHAWDMHMYLFDINNQGVENIFRKYIYTLGADIK